MLCQFTQDFKVGCEADIKAAFVYIIVSVKQHIMLASVMSSTLQLYFPAQTARTYHTALTNTATVFHIFS